MSNKNRKRAPEEIKSIACPRSKKPKTYRHDLIDLDESDEPSDEPFDEPSFGMSSSQQSDDPHMCLDDAIGADDASKSSSTLLY